MSAIVTIENITFLLSLSFNTGKFPQELKKQKLSLFTNWVPSSMEIITGLFHYLLFGARLQKIICLIGCTLNLEDFICFIIDDSDFETNTV